MSPTRLLGLVVLLAIACFATWKVHAWRYGKQLAEQSAAYQTELTPIARAAADQRNRPGNTPS